MKIVFLIVSIFYFINVSSQEIDTFMINIDSTEYFEVDSSSFFSAFLKKKQLKTDLPDGHYVVYQKKTYKRFLRRDEEYFDIIIQVSVIDKKYEGDYVKYDPETRSLYIDSYKNGVRDGYSIEYHFDGIHFLVGKKYYYEEGKLIRRERHSELIKHWEIKN
ncbi:MAG: hypothetical protein COA32_10135 [Fluviicola sp.]|nr:MAG: hypothetical protein COA32_10135 [Fluviicola sp.]